MECQKIVVSQSSAVRTYVLTDNIECQEEIPDTTYKLIEKNLFL